MADGADPTVTCPTCNHPWSEHRPRPFFAWFGLWRCEHSTGAGGASSYCGCPNVPPKSYQQPKDG